jgi:hypothetical protein
LDKAWKIRTATLVSGLALTCMLDPPANAQPVLVDPADMGYWSFTSASSSGAILTNPPGYFGGMVTGPATPPLGTGSAQLELAAGNGAGAEILANTNYAGTPLSSLTALSYSTYLTNNAPNGQQFPYLAVDIKGTVNGTTTYDTLFFEPPYQTTSTGNPLLPNQQATALDTWQTWNALEGGWWDNDGYCKPGTGVQTLATCTTAFTDPTIINAFGTATALYSSVLPGVGGLQLQVGFADASDAFNGYVDALTVGINGTNTTYNFDPNPAPAPEPGTLALLGTGLLGAVAARRRGRRGA